MRKYILALCLLPSCAQVKPHAYCKESRIDSYFERFTVYDLTNEGLGIYTYFDSYGKKHRERGKFVRGVCH